MQQLHMAQTIHITHSLIHQQSKFNFFLRPFYRNSLKEIPGIHIFFQEHSLKFSLYEKCSQQNKCFLSHFVSLFCLSIFATNSIILVFAEHTQQQHNLKTAKMAESTWRNNIDALCGIHMNSMQCNCEFQCIYSICVQSRVLHL